MIARFGMSSNQESNGETPDATRVGLDDDVELLQEAITNPQAFAPIYDKYFDVVHGYYHRQIAN